MKDVLVPMDGSTAAEAALSEAFERFPEAKVHVFHVIQVTAFPRDRSKSAYELAAEKGVEIQEKAEEIAAEHGRNIVTDMTEGNAPRSIVQYATENNIDHIVMGSTGRSGLSKVLLGSVAESVTRRAPCTVTIVRKR